MINWINRQIKRIAGLNDVNLLKNEEYQEKAERLSAKGIKLEKAIYSQQGMKKKWLDKFAGNIDTRGADVEAFLWHVFSFERITASAIEDQANMMFDQIEKGAVIIFYQNEEEVYTIKDAKALKAADLESEDDIFIVDEDFQWTYVNTHEMQCGPYFYSI